MPELPEVEALADHLRRYALGKTIERIDVASLSVLKTFAPPVSTLHGRVVTGVHRWGNTWGCKPVTSPSPTWRGPGGCAGRTNQPRPAQTRQGPIALRVHFDSAPDVAGRAAGEGFDLTEAGTQKRLAVWLTEDPSTVEGTLPSGLMG